MTPQMLAIVSLSECINFVILCVFCLFVAGTLMYSLQPSVIIMSLQCILVKLGETSRNLVDLVAIHN